VLPQGLSYASQRADYVKGQIAGGAFFVQTRYPQTAISQPLTDPAGKEVAREIGLIRRPSYVFSLREGQIIKLADLERQYRESVRKLTQVEPGQIDVFIDVMPYDPEKATFQIEQ